MLDYNEVVYSFNGDLMQRLQRDTLNACSTDSGRLTSLNKTAHSPERLIVTTESYTTCSYI